MQRIVILGGGCRGHPHRQPPRQKLRAADRPRRRRDHRRRRHRPARLSARLHVHRDGRQKRAEARAAGALAARQARHARRRRGRRASTRRARPSADRRPDAAVRRSWSSPPARASCPRRSSTSTPRPITSTPPRRRPRLRAALDAFRGAGSSSASPGCPTSARRRRSRSPSSSRRSSASAASATSADIHFCSPIGRAFTIESVSRHGHADPRGEGDRAAHVLQRRGDRPGAQAVVSLEGEELPYDLLILVPPHKGQQFLIDSGLAPAPGGWLPTDRHTLLVGGRPNVYALGDATDLPLSKAGSTAHFEAPVVAERIVAAIEGRAPAGKHADYEGRVMCFFEIGDGKGTLLQFDYDHPPAAAEAQPALAPGQDRLQQDVLAHGPQGPRMTRR